ncbi:hypothetical protein FA15DRAFT_658775 [Coprinopsis marcescibilis]|uniref:Uncharacterized protein n=1 Tax=Coprinopsis marcescibilis TaxID=230819 RepID=A0A5C3KLR5_COPMA|nr:hypothetical protein FA15DRAFT_658775 [Coprinopsis marcescibilis]
MTTMLNILNESPTMTFTILSRYRVISPAAFKVGDIVEALILIGCVPVKKTLKMIIMILALMLIDHTECNQAALLRMRQRYHGAKAVTGGYILKRKSAYSTDADIGSTESAIACMRLD